MSEKGKKWIWAGFGLYCGALAWLLFGRRLGLVSPEDYYSGVVEYLNLRPLTTVRHFLRLIFQSGKLPLIRFAAVNLAGNIGAFVPLGVFLPLLWPAMRRFWRFALFLLGLIAAVELVQLWTRLGVCDVDDLILNMTGGLLGYGLFRLGRRLWTRRQAKE